VHVFPVGSTASVTTIEYEPALVKDFQNKLEEFSARDWLSRVGSKPATCGRFKTRHW
jgi:thiamine phosphate synthase YjbQ (UPF0047 family)